MGLINKPIQQPQPPQQLPPTIPAAATTAIDGTPSSTAAQPAIPGAAAQKHPPARLLGESRSPRGKQRKRSQKGWSSWVTQSQRICRGPRWATRTTKSPRTASRVVTQMRWSDLLQCYSWEIQTYLYYTVGRTISTPSREETLRTVQTLPEPSRKWWNRLSVLWKT